MSQKDASLLKIRVYSDYICPFCYLSQKPLEEAAAQTGVEIEWLPFELRPYPAPASNLDPEFRAAVWLSSVLPLAERLGVLIKQPDIHPDPHTHLAHYGFQFAKQHGLGRQYHKAVFAAYFQEGRDIGRMDVLVDVAWQVGLDGSEFRTALVDGRYAEAHRRALRAAFEAGVTAVPTFEIDSRMLRGVQPVERLRQAIEREQAQGGPLWK